MSDANASATEPTSTDTSAPNPAPVAASEPKPEPKPDDKEPNWLNGRLEQAKRSARSEMLSELGIDDPEKLKAIVKRAAELEESSKSEIEKLTDKLSKLSPQAKKAEELSERLGRYADAELSKLTENQRAAVEAIAGGDKSRVLETIEALRPTWSTKPKDDAEAPKPKPAPANTGSNGAAPPEVSATTVDHKATYEALKQTNEYQAKRYYLAHRAEILASQ